MNIKDKLKLKKSKPKFKIGQAVSYTVTGKIHGSVCQGITWVYTISDNDNLVDKYSNVVLEEKQIRGKLWLPKLPKTKIELMYDMYKSLNKRTKFAKDIKKAITHQIIEIVGKKERRNK